MTEPWHQHQPLPLDVRLRTAVGAFTQQPGTPYGLLDFPHHSNTGDSAIWVGERMLLQSLCERPPTYVSASYSRPEELGRFLPEGGIFLHGGGNFGDLWPLHQDYREQILALYPLRRVVLLPQSIHFRDQGALERARRVIGRHRDFHLMVRDRPSFDFAYTHFDCPVILAPDSAFAIKMDRFPPAGIGTGIRCLFRDDQEQRADATDRAALFAGLPNEDWRRPPAQALNWRQRALLWSNRAATRLPGQFWMGLRLSLYDQMAAALVQTGLAQLAEAHVVVTDRLHGHILSSLLGRPHVVIDNFYGKIRNYIDAWSAIADCRISPDYATARREAEALLARRTGEPGPSR